MAIVFWSQFLHLNLITLLRFCSYFTYVYNIINSLYIYMLLYSIIYEPVIVTSLCHLTWQVDTVGSFLHCLYGTFSINPFPNTINLQQRTENIPEQNRKLPVNECTIIEQSWKHGDKRRNCLFWAISSFVAMFSKTCLLQRRRKPSI